MQSVDRFVRDESGAVTTDWVVLTSGIAVLAVIVLFLIQPAITEMAIYIRDTIFAYQVFLE